MACAAGVGLANGVEVGVTLAVGVGVGVRVGVAEGETVALGSGVGVGEGVVESIRFRQTASPNVPANK